MTSFFNIINNKYYIVRNGDFATNGNTKIIYSLLAIILSLFDYFFNNSFDSIKILAGSSILWAIIELILSMTQIRIIKRMTINYNNQIVEIDKYLGLLFQGIQEGGFITIIGLFFGDYINNIYYMIVFHLLILIIVLQILNKTNKLKSSRRQVNNQYTNLIMFSATIFNIYKIYNNPSHLYRQFKMFFIMIYLSAFWTFFTWYKGFRCVEVEKLLYNNIVVLKANRIEEFCVLAYDIIFEIGIAYLTFYNLFLL